MGPSYVEFELCAGTVFFNALLEYYRCNDKQTLKVRYIQAPICKLYYKKEGSGYVVNVVTRGPMFIVNISGTIIVILPYIPLLPLPLPPHLDYPAAGVGPSHLVD